MPNGQHEQRDPTQPYRGAPWDECRMYVLNSIVESKEDRANLWRKCNENAVGLAKLLGMCAASAAAGGLIFKVGESVLTGGG